VYVKDQIRMKADVLSSINKSDIIEKETLKETEDNLQLSNMIKIISTSNYCNQQLSRGKGFHYR